jgi:tetratricopeptide (TPR) repeat protein
MTKEIWKSAFVAALFALHPLHVESVAWISERKDVLSAFFWMLTLCLYVYYTRKPTIKRYLLILFAFVLALMSKPMVITLPVIMILLDYWPLKRFESQKSNLIFWQLTEKLPFLILSAVFIIITIFAQHDPSGTYFPLVSRLANAPVAFVTYLGKTFRPHDLAVFYPFPSHIPIWQVIGATFLIIVVSAIVIIKAKRLPYLFVGWLWYTIILMPVIGIVQVGNHSMAERYTYLPLIGISIGLAWGVPLLFPGKDIRKIVLFPITIAILLVLAVLAWQQCGYWRNSISLFDQTLRVTKDNYIAHGSLGIALFKEGKTKEAIDHYNKAILIRPDYSKPYDSRGIAYDKLGQYQKAIEDFNIAIRLNSEYAASYNNRGTAYYKSGQHQQALEDYNMAIRLKEDYADAYNNRGIVYSELGQYQKAIEDFSKAISLNPAFVDAYNNRAAVYTKLDQYQLALNDLNKAIAANHDYLKSYINSAVIYEKFNQYDNVIKNLTEAIRLQPDNALFYYNRGFAYTKLGQYNAAINDFDKAIQRKEDYTDAYNIRAAAYLNQRNIVSGCQDAKKACELGNCLTLQAARAKELCH